MLIHTRFSLPSDKTRTARYIPVRQLTGTWTGRYRAVPLRSAVDGRFRSLTVDFRRRWSISAVCGRFKEKSTVGSRLRKKKERRRRRKEEEEEEEEEKYLAPPGGCLQAVAARAGLAPSPPALP
ncbi:hypothetical protein BHM03_00020161 [Ensete ventricosum]|uniref:Uncharacterized protein n=1 Tax=Ensete ventricosum TaxID=4639 RepID=A0A426YHR2_ENSVE|nr:hypothetical protein B296_00051242 [Ensete ventricosum]RZR91972.1 hypothetical protein BHM03_00020161 [Ensete ventricosum]